MSSLFLYPFEGHPKTDASRGVAWYEFRDNSLYATPWHPIELSYTSPNLVDAAQSIRPMFWPRSSTERWFVFERPTRHFRPVFGDSHFGEAWFELWGDFVIPTLANPDYAPLPNETTRPRWYIVRPS